MAEFLHTLFDGKRESDYILLWEKGDSTHSTWHTSVDSAIEHAHKCLDHNIYFGVGTSPQDFGPKRRCMAEYISGIPGLWLDIDVAHEVHTKAHLPKTNEDIEAILSVIPYKPSIVVNSGHGYHYWWLFKEFWVFDSVEERDRARRLSHRFAIACRDQAKSLGFEIDMTFDLARILRPPGTFNHNSHPAVPVTINQESDARYDPDDFDNLLPQLPKAELAKEIHRQVPDAVKTENFILDPNAEPPSAKLLPLLEADTLFRDSWNMTRADFVSGKSSPSEYDLSLADITVKANWTDQEIVNLLIAFRRNHGLPPKGGDGKPLRKDYYERTLKKARAGASSASGASCASTIPVSELVSELLITPSLPEERRREVVSDTFMRLFHAPIKRLVCYTGYQKSWALQSETDEVRFENIDRIINYRLFRLLVAELCNCLIPPFSKDAWATISDTLLKIMEFESLGNDNTIAGIVQGWLTAFLHERPPQYDRVDGFQMNRAFFENNKFYLTVEMLRAWLWDSRKDHVAPREIRLNLKHVGFETRIMSSSAKRDPKETGSTSFSVWYLPADHEYVAPFFDVNIMERVAEEHRQKVANNVHRFRRADGSGG